VTGKTEEVDVFQLGLGGFESISGIGIGEHANLVLPGNQMRRNHLQTRFECLQFIVAGDDLRPDLSTQRAERLRRGTFQQNRSIRNDGHARTKFTDILDDVG
jgi:hypothetical protein